MSANIIHKIWFFLLSYWEHCIKLVITATFCNFVVKIIIYQYVYKEIESTREWKIGINFFSQKLKLTFIRPMSRPSALLHAHCFQFLWSASAPFCPASPLTPRDPGGPATPLSPFAPSRPSRPGNPLYPFRPGIPDGPWRHVPGCCVIKEATVAGLTKVDCDVVKN